MHLESIRTSSRAALQSGMTFIEIMIVIIIMAMIATGVGMAILPGFERAKIKQAKSDVAAMRSAVQLYLAENSGKCPTIEDLKNERYVDKSKKTIDPWDQEFIIRCPEGDDPEVISTGPDKQEGTEDDIK